MADTATRARVRLRLARQRLDDARSSGDRAAARLHQAEVRVLGDVLEGEETMGEVTVDGEETRALVTLRDERDGERFLNAALWRRYDQLVVQLVTTTLDRDELRERLAEIEAGLVELDGVLDDVDEAACEGDAWRGELAALRAEIEETRGHLQTATAALWASERVVADAHAALDGAGVVRRVGEHRRRLTLRERIQRLATRRERTIGQIDREYHAVLSEVGAPGDPFGDGSELPLSVAQRIRRLGLYAAVIESVHQALDDAGVLRFERVAMPGGGVEPGEALSVVDRVRSLADARVQARQASARHLALANRARKAAREAHQTMEAAHQACDRAGAGSSSTGDLVERIDRLGGYITKLRAELEQARGHHD